MKRSKTQWIISIVLALVTVALAAGSVAGYITRSTDKADASLKSMRTYATMHTAAMGIVEEVAKQAKSEAKEWAQGEDADGNPNIKGRDNQRDYYNKAEAEARAQAEKDYANFDDLDMSALENEIPVMEECLKAYYDLELTEKAVYDKAYTAASEKTAAFVDELMVEVEGSALTIETLEPEHVSNAAGKLGDCSEEEAAAYQETALNAANAIKDTFGLEDDYTGKNGFDALNAAVTAIAEIEPEVKAEKAAALEGTVNELDTMLTALNGEHFVTGTEIDAKVEEFQALCMTDATAIYTEAYGELTPDVEKGLKKAYKKLLNAALDEKLAADQEKTGISDAVTSEDAEEDTTLKIDYSGFVGSSDLDALEENVNSEYANLWSVMEGILPALTDDMAEDQQEPIQAVIYSADNSYEAVYTRLDNAKATSILSGSESFLMKLSGMAYNLLLGTIAFAVLTLVAFFAKPLVKKLGIPRLIIGVFFIMLLILSGLYGLNMSSMMSNVLKRTGQYGILALAMLPGIQCGISLNMGMTVGIVAGLLSTLMALEWNMTGWAAFSFAVVVGAIIAIPIGWLYAKLLNRLKGSEMTVSTYVGFAFVSLMSIFWMVLPFKNPKLTWALGSGLRVMHSMTGNIGGLLNNFLSFTVFGVTVPTGLLLFLLLCCFLLWLFSRSRTGTAMIAAGSNPRFAEASGISVDRMRTVGTTLSTMIAAIGIIVYSQSFGFMQLYSGPRQMGFTAASAILIGGASTSRAKVSHVIIGSFLFQGVLSMGILVANQAISASGLSEVMRILISNGIILYALTQSGGEN